MTQTSHDRVPDTVRTIALGLAPWAAAYIGAYVLRSAVAAFALYHVLCLTGGANHRRLFGPRGHKTLPRRGWVGLAVGGLAVCLGTYAALGAFGAVLEPARVSHALHGLGISSRLGIVIGLFAYFAVINPIAEEVFWRGTVYVEMRASGWSVQQSSVASALLFGSWHWLIVRLFFKPAVALLLTIGIAIAGYLFARLYERLHSLPALILIHGLAADVPILIALWFAVLAKG